MPHTAKLSRRSVRLVVEEHVSGHRRPPRGSSPVFDRHTEQKQHPCAGPKPRPSAGSPIGRRRTGDRPSEKFLGLCSLIAYLKSDRLSCA